MMVTPSSPRVVPAVTLPQGGFSPRTPSAAFQQQPLQSPLQSALSSPGPPHLRISSPGGQPSAAVSVASPAGGSFTLAPTVHAMYSPVSGNGICTPRPTAVPSAVATPSPHVAAYTAPPATPSPAVGSSPPRVVIPATPMGFGTQSSASTPCSTPFSASTGGGARWTKARLAEKLRSRLQEQQQQHQQLLLHQPPQQPQDQQQQQHQLLGSLASTAPAQASRQSSYQPVERRPSHQPLKSDASQSSLHRQASARLVGSDSKSSLRGVPVGTPVLNGTSTPRETVTSSAPQTLSPNASTHLLGSTSVQGLAPSGSMRLLTPRSAAPEGLSTGGYTNGAGGSEDGPKASRPESVVPSVSGTSRQPVLQRPPSPQASMKGVSCRGPHMTGGHEAVSAARHTVLVASPLGGVASESRLGTPQPRTPQQMSRMVSAPELREGRLLPYSARAAAPADLENKDEQDDALFPYQGPAGDLRVASSVLSAGTFLALQSDGLRHERRKLVKAQEKTRHWLKKALSEQISVLEAEMSKLRRIEEKVEKREQVLAVQSEATAPLIQAKREARELKDMQYLENRLVMEIRRRADMEAKMKKERLREERIIQERCAQLDEVRERAVKQDAHRRAVSEEAKRLVRTRVQKLKERTEIEAEKAEALVLERKRIHELRRAVTAEGKGARQKFKRELKAMQAQPSFRPQQLREKVEAIVSSDIYDPELADM